MWRVDRHTLMTLPEGTIYTSEMDPGLYVKGETLVSTQDGKNIDWVELCLCTPQQQYGCDPLHELGDSGPLGDDHWGRNGYFSDKDRFFVYDEHDLKVLKRFIDEALSKKL